MRTSKNWYYKYPGTVYAYGPIRHDNKITESEFRHYVRSMIKIKRLPNGFECWPTKD